MKHFIKTLLIVMCTGCSLNTPTELKSINELVTPKKEELLFVSHEVILKNQNLRMYWKRNDRPIKTFQNLRDLISSKGKKLKFAMNGGMYLKDYSPQGLYIENGEIFRALNTKKSNYGNFYLAPNGIFYLTDNNKAVVCKTDDFRNDSSIQYATQSGPMLLINGTIHPKFTKGSKNVHIRNGVGVLPNGNPIFMISTKPVNLYDFADFFRKQGCKNALYLDGFVSRLYLPEKEIKQMDGRFGVMIAEVQ